MTGDVLAKFILSSIPDITNKKLQKLCYYVYSWYLTIYHRKIANVVFEAWAHGPVSPMLYNQYRCYGWETIPRYQGFLPIKEEDIKFVNKVILYYGNFTADELEEMTHNEDPWKKARIGCKPYESSNQIIQDQDIIDYYSAQEYLFDEFNK